MKTLFNTKLLEEKAEQEIDLSKHNLLERRNFLKKWINLLDKGILENSKEEELQGEFINDIFSKVLNAINKTEGEDNWNIQRETKTKIDGQKADAVLGFFNLKKEDIRVAIELKGPKINLDTRQKRSYDNRTPVEQAFGYAPKYGKNCTWVIVSNYKEIRLYRANDMTEYQEFTLNSLKDDLEFKKFIYILSFNALIGTQKYKAKTLELAEEFQKNQEQIEKKFYLEYKKIRLEVFKNIKKNNAHLDEIILLEKTQKLLDRFLFICFAEDKNLLPPESYKRLVNKGHNIDDIFECFKMFCRHIDKGSKKYDINAYNGGLFKEDDVLDDLIIDNQIFDKLEIISNYDFESELNENILGHIFEQSISDLEEIKKEISGENFNKKKGKRKKDGIFYTPKYICKYIVENTIKNWLDDKRRELGENELPALTEKDYRIHISKKKRYTDNYQEHVNFWKKYRECVRNIKILDPACGSGAFLLVAFEFLYNHSKYINEKIIDLTGSYQMFGDLTKEILINNIFGVDLNKESIEITKLSLWLKTADQGKPLTSLDKNIKCGNSIIEHYGKNQENTFIWENEFPDIFNNGGFDIVIGNPPYGVNFNDIEKIYLDKNYGHVPDFEIYIYFVSLYKKLLSKNGKLSYIFPNTFLSNIFGKDYRKNLFSETNVYEIVDLSDDKTFSDASVRTCILSLSNNINNFSETTLKKFKDNYFYPLKTLNKKQINESVENILSLFYRTSEENTIINKMICNSNKLNDFFYVSQGLIPYDKYKGHDPETIKNRIWHSSFKKDSTFKKELKGEDINQYSLNWNQKLWISYGEWLAAPRDPIFFNAPRVLVREITSPNLKCTYTEDEYYNTPSIINIISREENNLKLKYLLALLNSDLFGWYHKKTSPKANKGLFPKILINDIKHLPIIKCDYQDQFIILVDELLNLNIEFNQYLLNFQNRLTNNFENIKISKKLKEFYNIDFNEFFKELKKNKIKLSLEIQDEWNQYFDNYKEKCTNLISQINLKKNKIDDKVYELYKLSKIEIKTIQNNQK